MELNENHTSNISNEGSYSAGIRNRQDHSEGLGQPRTQNTQTESGVSNDVIISSTLKVKTTDVSGDVVLENPASPSIYALTLAVESLNKEFKVSKGKHILRTVIVILIFLLCVFIMTVVQVYMDNEALSYYYGVTTPAEFTRFKESMSIVANNPALEEKFPSILISTQFGGSGDHGALLDPYGNKTRHALLLDDIIFRNSDWKYSRVKLIADMLVIIYALMTIAFLLLLPYFDAFKTVIRKKLRKTSSTRNQSAAAHEQSNNIDSHYSHAATPVSSTAFLASQKNSPNLHHSNSSMSNTPSTISKMYTSTSIFLFSSRYIHGLVFLRRLIIVLGLNYLARACVVGLTIFPQESTECIPVLRSTFGEKLYGALLMLLSIQPACHDFIFSGHTSVSTILTWFWVIYSTHALFHPRRYFIDLDSFIANEGRHNNGGNGSSSSEKAPAIAFNRTIQIRKRSKISTFIITLIRLSAFFVLGFIAVCLVISRIHYTVDIVLGFLVGSMIFWLWHALITIYYYFKFKSHILDFVDASFITSTGTTPPSQTQTPQSQAKKLEPRSPSPTLVPTGGGPVIDLKEEKLRANREVRDVLVPIKRTNIALNFVGWIDGYDLYVKDNIGFCSPESLKIPRTDNHHDSYSCGGDDNEGEPEVILTNVTLVEQDRLNMV